MVNNQVKLARWLDFAKRMIGAMPITTERKEKLINEVEGFIGIYGVGEREIVGWDTTLQNGDMCVSSLFDEHFEEYETWNPELEEYTGKFHNQLACAIHAGIDVVTQEWGGGVLGFDVGDLKNMYDGRIPHWVSSALELTGSEPDHTMIWL